MANQNFGVGGFGKGGYGTAALSFLPPDYYVNLLTQKYAGSEPFKAMLRAMVEVFTDIQYCCYTFDAAYNLDHAIGKQLDDLGVLIGASRLLPFQPSNGVSPLLGDHDYRTLLYAKAAANRYTGDKGAIQPLWKKLFPGGSILIVQTAAMEADVVLVGAFSSLQEDMINNGLIVPRPQGVKFNYIYAKLPLFGFDQNNNSIAGFDTGYFG